ncbi:hypothetical protein DID88_005824 [Monilinia fructigena]|uniref:Csf1 C-terminal region domain-containing protein n=1 Tax=Monilinia fructigena TaxID=38457 RepID=A0A395J0X8_9HELO|nr:hypothetical protein DID88_005824 [Monilinia fructigena]
MNLRDIQPDRVDENATHVSFIVELPHGIKAVFSPKAVGAVADLLSALQPVHPVDMIDDLQYDLSVSQLAVTSRSETTGTSNAISAKSEKESSAIHLSLGSAVLAAKERFEDINDPQAAVNAILEDVVFWIVSGRISCIIGTSHEYSRRRVGETFASRLSQQRNRLQLFTYLVATAGEHATDPLFLTRPAYVLRSAQKHLRTHDSWKIITRLRHMYSILGKSAKLDIINRCANNAESVPEDAAQLVLASFAQWRSWDLNNLGTCFLVSNVFGLANDGSAIAISEAPNIKDIVFEQNFKGLKASVIMTEGVANTNLFNIMLAAEAATSKVQSHSQPLSLYQLRSPSVYISHENSTVNEVPTNVFKVAANSQELSFIVQQDILALIEVLDLVIGDEVAQLHRLVTKFPTAKHPASPLSSATSSIQGPKPINKVHLALFLDMYQISIPLIQSLTYTISGVIARASLAAQFGSEIVFDFDIKEHSHDVKTTQNVKQQSISLLQMPPTNGRVISSMSDEENKISVFASVEPVELDAAAVHSLLTALNRPEVSSVISDIRDDIKAIQAHFEEIFGSRGSLALSTPPKAGPAFIYDAHLTFAGLDIYANAEQSQDGKTTARLEFNVGCVQLLVANRLEPRGPTYEFPEIHIGLHRMMFELSRRNNGTMEPCGNLAFAAFLAATSKKNEMGDDVRSFNLTSNGLEINLFAETASSVVDVMGHLQNKIKDIDFTREKQYFKKFRKSRPRIIVNDEHKDHDSVTGSTSTIMFASMYTLELLNIQVSQSTRRLAFQAAGKSLDLRLTSQFIIPAAQLQRSIGSAAEMVRVASATWSTSPSSTLPLPAPSNTRQPFFGRKRMESLLVDADFAGAVVHLSGKKQAESTRSSQAGIGGHTTQTGRYGQFTHTDTGSSTVLRAPGLAWKVEYKDNGLDDPSLNAEISSSVKDIVSEDGKDKKLVPKASPQKFMGSDDDNILAADPSAVLGRTRLNLGLRICKQEFTLSCQPIARVAASARFDEIYMTINTVRSTEHGHFFAASVAFSRLQASVQHVYSRESTGSFDVDSIFLSLMNTREKALNQTPLVQGSLGFSQLRVKAAFDYQAFLVADITTFEFLMYNVRNGSQAKGDRLVAILDGEAVQIFCTATTASQALALYQAFLRLAQEKKISLAINFAFSKIPLTEPKSEKLKSPVSLHTDVIVTLKALNVGAFPSTFSDHQVFKIEALNAQAQFAVRMDRGKIHSILGLTLGQLRIGLAGVKQAEAPKSVSDLSVEDVVDSVTGSRGGVPNAEDPQSKEGEQQKITAEVNVPIKIRICGPRTSIIETPLLQSLGEATPPLEILRITSRATS